MIVVKYWSTVEPKDVKEEYDCEMQTWLDNSWLQPYPKKEFGTPRGLIPLMVLVQRNKSAASVWGNGAKKDWYCHPWAMAGLPTSAYPQITLTLSNCDLQGGKDIAGHEWVLGLMLHQL